MDEFAPPSDLAALSQGERLLLRTTRALALDIGCKGFRTQLEEACGWAGPEACRALGVFVAQLGLKGRRRLVVALPGGEQVTADEQLLLAVFAAAQGEDYRGLDVALRRLLGCEPQRPMGAAACLVAQTLALNGLVLRWRAPAGDLTTEWSADWVAAPRRSAASPPAV